MATPNKRGEPQWWRETWRNALVVDAEIPPTSKHVAEVLSEYADKSPDPPVSVQLSISRLTLETSRTKNTVKAALADLVDRGWLVLIAQGVGVRPNRYGLTRPRGSATDPLALSRGSATDPAGDPLGGQSPTLGGQFRGPRGSMAGTQSIDQGNQLSRPTLDLAGRLGWPEDDDRLKGVDEWLRAAGIRSPRGFFDSRDPADLQRQFLDYLAHRPSPPSLPHWQDPNRDVRPAPPDFIRQVRARPHQENP